ncbi:MAG: helix-turn-helix transcriptional regulator [Clostridia bacterium]|nr:helix-turn-helix transcriptional regulator [Clostridia bacterium]
MNKYFKHRVKKAIVVQNLITVEFLDIGDDFTYPEETHDFYEFAYIDNGAIYCHIENDKIQLSQGDFLLIAPHKRHFYSSVELGERSSIFIVCFQCSADVLSILEQKISLSSDLKILVANILQEAKNAFEFPFNRKLKLLDSPLYASQQLVENNIETLLIQLIRNETKQNEQIKFVMSSIEKERNLISDIISLLKNNLYARLTLEQISQQTYYSKTILNHLFKKNMGITIMQYYNGLKIEEAKKLLRKNHSSAEIANLLTFESATYFTKVFKKYVGMTPSAYKKRIL